jgi:hypothetical protein
VTGIRCAVSARRLVFETPIPRAGIR